MSAELPPLPDLRALPVIGSGIAGHALGYTADQMLTFRAEALAAQAAEVQALRAALAELVALKDIKDECLRVRQRRPQSVTRRFPQDLLDAEADYNKRKPLAWAAARAALKEQKI